MPQISLQKIWASLEIVATAVAAGRIFPPAKIHKEAPIILQLLYYLDFTHILTFISSVSCHRSGMGPFSSFYISLWGYHKHLHHESPIAHSLSVSYFGCESQGLRCCWPHSSNKKYNILPVYFQYSPQRKEYSLCKFNSRHEIAILWHTLWLLWTDQWNTLLENMFSKNSICFLKLHYVIGLFSSLLFSLTSSESVESQTKLSFPQSHLEMQQEVKWLMHSSSSYSLLVYNC